MKRVVVVSSWERTANTIRRQLENLFGDFIEVDFTSIERGVHSTIQADLVLVATTKVSSYISKYVAAGTYVLVMKRTITRAGWDMIMAIPPQTKVLLVNDLQESTYETMALLYELGAKHLDLIPYYPGVEDFELPQIAITPNEVSLVPANVEKVVNIGDRVLDAYTISDILTKLDLFNNKTARQLAFKCLEDTIPCNPKLFGGLNTVMESKQHLELVLEVVDEGVIAYDEEGKIIIFNKFAERIFRNPPWKVKGTLLQDVFSDILDNIRTAAEVKDVTFTINGNNYIVNKYPLYLKDQYVGGVIRFKEYTEIERLEQKIRQETRNKGYVAKYSFADIIGTSQALMATRALATKMAKGDSTILIEGESGTGKELFAQAIHNASSRRDNPFVAFNCASVPDALIESELFGYEDGAFTGARKGGKPGLFELANHGTVFLDEIGDISKNMQAKLLRILQEKEIVRIGGYAVKPIDIRVIAATNRNLRDLVAKEDFRKDLYYRINVLLLRVPSLKERQSDILPLINYFLGKYGVNRIIAEEVLAALQLYPWPGNIRELENCVAYLVNMSDDKCIGSRDLPISISDYINSRSATGTTDEQPFDAGDFGEMGLILTVIHEAQQGGRTIGRGEISKRLKACQVHLTEQEVRSRLKKLAATQYISIGKGRAGTKLTVRGEKMIAINGLNGLLKE